MSAPLVVPEALAPRPAPALQAARIATGAFAFLLSGSAALIYQVAWQRILALHSGVGIYSVAMIVAAFMAGLGVGSHVGGVLSLRVAPRGAVRIFALVELGIGAFGALSCWLYYDLLYLKASWLYADLWRAGLLHFLGLFVPTCLMGMSLPFLVRGMVSEASSAGRVVGTLYGVNLLGASLGALLTPWFLFPNYGIRGAVTAAALLNLAVGILGLGVGTLRPRAEGGQGAPPVAEAPQPFPLWVGLYALSGFVALSLEIVWFRVLDLAVKATAYTFGTLLALYLAGMAAGCLAGALAVSRLRRPLGGFLLCQCVLLAYAGLAMVLLARLPVDTPGYAWLFDYWRRGAFDLGQSDAPQTLRRLYLWLPLLLFGPSTILMGLSFPILQRAVQEDPRTSGRKVGILQAANIAGCVLGSLLVGLVGFSWLGTTGIVRALLAGGGLAFAGLGIRTYGARSVFGVAGVGLAVLAIAQPGQRQLWLRLHGVAGNVPAMVEEDATGLAALIARAEKRWVVYVNGKGHSWVPFGGVHTQLGAMAAAMHRAPHDVAVIGLGSGDTAWAAASRPETRRLTVFEISGPQPRLLRRLADTEDLPVLRRFLDDPRLRIRVADGRTALGAGGARYDIIEADALWPGVAYAGNLYSVEFFEHCARHLKPGGLVVTWAPTRRVYSSFVTAFKHVLGNGDRSILVGSNEALEPDPETWKARLQSPQVTAYLGQQAVDRTIALLYSLGPYHLSGRRQPERDKNFDLFPRDEFLSR